MEHAMAVPPRRFHETNNSRSQWKRAKLILQRISIRAFPDLRLGVFGRDLVGLMPTT
jgi:hypothetical protein